MTADRHRSGEPIADRRADYAEGYARAGDLGAAIDLMRQALEVAPGWPLGHVRLAAFQADRGEIDAAAVALRTALDLDPADRYGAALKLASLGRGPVPDVPPTAFVAALFDDYAEAFDQALVERLGYVVPDILFAEIARSQGPALRFGAVLDLGCGTGLMGERLRPVAERLVGVDLSDRMLAKARQKAIYDELIHGDLTGELPRADGGYDLVTAADVFSYVGELGPVFGHVAALIAPDALFAFSVERLEVPGLFELRPSLRYAHSEAYIEAALDEAGFVTRTRWRGTLRQDRGADIEGLVVMAALR